MAAVMLHAVLESLKVNSWHLWSPELRLHSSIWPEADKDDSFITAPMRLLICALYLCFTFFNYQQEATLFTWPLFIHLHESVLCKGKEKKLNFKKSWKKDLNTFASELGRMFFNMWQAERKKKKEPLKPVQVNKIELQQKQVTLKGWGWAGFFEVARRIPLIPLRYLFEKCADSHPGEQRRVQWVGRWQCLISNSAEKGQRSRGVRGKTELKRGRNEMWDEEDRWWCIVSLKTFWHFKPREVSRQ